MTTRMIRLCFCVIALTLVASRALALSPVVKIPGYAQRWVVKSLTPEYPSSARTQHITGSGIFVLRVQIKTGVVKEVVVARSTGNGLLDSAATTALGKWRFKPGVLPPIKEILPNREDPFALEDSLIKVPVNFSL
jgi:TonB family protein